MDSRIDQLERLARLHAEGNLTAAEFEAEKARLPSSDDYKAPDRDEHGGVGRIVIACTLAAAFLVFAVWAVRSYLEVNSSAGITMNTSSAAEKVVASAPANLAPEEQLARGFAAAFDRRDRARGFKPLKIIPVGTHLAVIAVAEGDGSHVSGGTFAVQYVDTNGKDFTKHGKRMSVETGSFGQIGDWKVRSDLGANKFITLEGGGTWQGCSSSALDLIELMPDEPVNSASVPISMGNDNDGGDGGYKGSLSKEGDHIVIHYNGSVSDTITLHRSGKLLLPDRALPEGC